MHVSDKMLRAKEVSHAPAGSVEGFADGADGEGIVGEGVRG